MDVFKQECKLCDNTITDDNFKVIEEATKHIFNSLLLQLTLNDEIQNVMCTTCYSNLIAAYNFKSACLHGDNIIIPYAVLEEKTSVDIKVCRLCFQPVSSDFKSLEEVPVDDILMCIPEIYFAIPTNPVICIKCHDALCTHSNFIKNCLEVEKKRNTTAMDVANILLTDSHIKTEEIELKSEPSDGDALLETPCDVVKEVHVDGGTSLRSQNGSAGTEESASLYDPEDPKLLKYQCDNCAFNTRFKHTFRRHQLVHKDPSEVEKYMCDRCDYKSIRKDHLRQHQFRHKDTSRVRLYVCVECDFKRRDKSLFMTHLCIPKDPSDMYMCDKCDYRSSNKQNVRKHQIKHKNPSEVQKYMCDKCDYKSVHRYKLKTHQLVHKDASEVEMYECEKCSFKTKYKTYIKKHESGHKDALDVQMRA